MSSIAENWLAIQKQCSEIASEPVRILGVTKGQPSKKILEAVQAGCTELGNNYVQDGEKLMTELSTEQNIQWHFIGAIQSRKVPQLLRYDCIESLDRLEIGHALNEKIEKSAKKTQLKFLIEINIGAETTKAGIALEKLPAFLEAAEKWKNLKCDGLMALPPPVFPVEDREKYFVEMRALFDTYKKEMHWNTLSMGTSEDFSVAVKAGANLIRLGTALFGPRS